MASSVSDKDLVDQIMIDAINAFPNKHMDKEHAQGEQGCVYRALESYDERSYVVLF